MIFASKVRRAGAAGCSGSDLSISDSCIKSQASCIKMQTLSIGAELRAAYRRPGKAAGLGIGNLKGGPAWDEPVGSRDELDAAVFIGTHAWVRMRCAELPIGGA